ncbi:MAG: DUF2188 domain-containing protein [Pseudomonadota bacterium]|nr:DUF2188 domain-containing protein [Pseudomonadota bacterium]
MVGRNFWAVPGEGGWEVRQEGLPNKTTRHPSRDEAWEAAKQGARDCHGEAYLGDGEGGCVERRSYRTLPRKAKI